MNNTVGINDAGNGCVAARPGTTGRPVGVPVSSPHAKLSRPTNSSDLRK